MAGKMLTSGALALAFALPVGSARSGTTLAAQVEGPLLIGPEKPPQVCARVLIRAMGAKQTILAQTHGRQGAGGCVYHLSVPAGTPLHLSAVFERGIAGIQDDSRGNAGIQDDSRSGAAIQDDSKPIMLKPGETRRLALTVRR